jgi:hypothetical protein
MAADWLGSWGPTLVQGLLIAGGALYVRGQLDGHSKTSVELQDGELDKHASDLKQVRSMADRTDALMNAHRAEDDRRFDGVERTMAAGFERIEGRLENLSAQIANVALGRHNRAYEIKPARIGKV